MNKFAKSCIAHKDEDGFNFAVRYNAVYNTAGDGLWSKVAKAVAVTEIGMYVNADEDEGCGDFYVMYDEATWDNEVDGLIYTDSNFLYMTQCAVYTALYKMGVDKATANEIASTIDYSEAGMQDDGRVSFDAFELAEFLRNFYAEETA